ncbi:ATPase domain-containing protein [Enterovirga sp.]|uniref:ATPase domain-containing protein n=1 Tax=Enterovirga sp. TaxID=2026350 RepID=UPI002605A767|nr:ATPase domain-containing protein [Enterovirga sp.]MDB5590436.1 circadian clock protein KaiC [Enterovirga sp.]
MISEAAAERAALGVKGLDEVLGGGLVRSRMYLLEGTPGTGKTTIALQFLLEGARAGETGLYITLSETEEELRDGAASHGWTIPDGILIYELAPPESLLDHEQQQSVLYSSDLELGETTRRIFEVVERLKPSRVVLDSLSEIRLLAQGSLRYRRQVLALKHYFSRHAATVLLLDDMTSEPGDKTVHSVAHGVVQLEQLAPTYGAERRRLRVLKYRGVTYRGGFHDFTIATGGVVAFPRLVSAEHGRAFSRAPLTSGIDSLDRLLGGGGEPGSASLLIGPSGSGKSILAYSFVRAAIARGERAAIFVFDEEIGILKARTREMGLDLHAMQQSGALALQAVDAAELSPGEFAHRVRWAVEQQGASTVVIDSLNGYHAAMPDEQHLVLHMHELLHFLNRQGTATFITLAQHGLVGDMRTPVDVTYLSDTIILLRYFEAAGEVRRAISVIKKRAGGHERTIRELQIDQYGIAVGGPLNRFQGVLRGVPSFIGEPASLLGADPA